MRRITALLLLPLLAAAPAFAEPLDYNVVSFSESASTTIDKDLMTVVFRIEQSNTDRQQASNTVTRRLNALNSRIKANSDFESEQVGRSVWPNYSKQKITGYTDTAYVQVKSKNFQALNKLIAASQSEAVLNSMSFSVSPQKHSETINQLSKQALKNFQARAASVSETLGFRGQYKIVNINIQSDFRTLQKAYGAGTRSQMIGLQADMAAVPEMNIEDAGREEITQTVNGSVQM